RDLNTIRPAICGPSFPLLTALYSITAFVARRFGLFRKVFLKLGENAVKEMPTVHKDARVHETRVVDRRELAPGVILLGFAAPDLARATRAGQYVMAIPPSGEAAAVALGIYEAHGD